MSRATTSGPGQRQPGRDRILGQFRPDLAIGRFRSIRHHRPPCPSFRRGSGRYRAGSVSSRSRNTPSAVILASACRSAEHDTAIATGQDAPCRGSRITRTSWQKYLPPNCAPMPIFRVIPRTTCFQFQVAEPVPERRPGGRQRVQVPGRRVLGGLQRELGAGAADHDRQVIRRAGGRARGNGSSPRGTRHPGRVQHRLGLLVQERLVRGTAALGHEQELVAPARVA